MKAVVAALVVGIAAFFTGLGAEAWLMVEPVARDAAAAGLEAAVAALAAGAAGWAQTIRARAP